MDDFIVKIKELQPSLFSGFLTIGTFLFAIKTFLVVKIKEDVIGSKDYLDSIAISNKIDNTANLEPLTPLIEFSDNLYYSSITAFSCSIVSLIFKLFPNPITVVICSVVAIYATCRLYSSMVMVKGNLDKWIRSTKE